MSILFHEKTKQFHLSNAFYSYVIGVMPNNEMGQLYFGRKVHDREDFSYLFESFFRPMQPGLPTKEDFSLESSRNEYPSFGSTDFRTPAYMINYANGAHVSHFEYEDYKILAGKPKLPGLPATYVENDSEAQTLLIRLVDRLTKAELELSYTVFEDYPVITRNVRFVNNGTEAIVLDRAFSASLDLPDHDYEWMQFSGAWGRERRPIVKSLDEGSVSIGSLRGHSSANHNPFVILKRKNADDFQGEALGFSFVYSGNFYAGAEVDTYGALRMSMGIHPECFSWKLEPGEEFVTPEVVITYTNQGLNDLSQNLHKLFRNRLSRGPWKTKERPILLNNWEATNMDFNEESILKIAAKGKEAGVELFVLDDGWFGERCDDYRGLGDWVVNTDKLPDGMKGLCEKVNALGLEFGFWIEPEMVNPDSDLYRAHPDWVLATPGRDRSLGRHQMVLDFSRPEVVDYIYDMLYAVLDGTNTSYIKWDMNRTITECFDLSSDADAQGKVYHKYILGVYSLYERLIAAFPNILFESCSSGGSRYDAGMLYYAPQTWCSDDTDAYERILIQYGTSFGYPISSIGAHVSAVPNQQTGRTVSIDTRANVAYFGTFGYELDLNELPEEEFEQVKEQVKIMKKYRGLIQSGKFYRLISPYEANEAAWMVVSEDQKQAIVGYYSILAKANPGIKRLRLKGLNPDYCYEMEENSYFGDELMGAGIVTSDECIKTFVPNGDFWSHIYLLEAK